MDYLKFDFCGVAMPGKPPENCSGVVGRSCGTVPVESTAQYAHWAALTAALNKTGRPVLYSCSWPDYIRTNSSGTGPVDYRNTAAHCNLWRMYNDIQDSWASVTDIIDWVGDNAPTNGMLDAAGPGAWNDPDMLIIGNFALSVEQSKAASFRTAARAGERVPLFERNT